MAGAGAAGAGAGAGAGGFIWHAYSDVVTKVDFLKSEVLALIEDQGMQASTNAHFHERVTGLQVTLDQLSDWARQMGVSMSSHHDEQNKLRERLQQLESALAVKEVDLRERMDQVCVDINRKALTEDQKMDGDGDDQKGGNNSTGYRTKNLPVRRMPVMQRDESRGGQSQQKLQHQQDESDRDDDNRVARKRARTAAGKSEDKSASTHSCCVHSCCSRSCCLRSTDDWGNDGWGSGNGWNW